VISQGISGLGPAEALIGVGRGYGAPGEARWRREISCSRDDVARPWTVLSGQVVVLGRTVCSTHTPGYATSQANCRTALACAQSCCATTHCWWWHVRGQMPANAPRSQGQGALHDPRETL